MVLWLNRFITCIIYSNLVKTVETLYLCYYQCDTKQAHCLNIQTMIVLHTTARSSLNLWLIVSHKLTIYRGASPLEQDNQGMTALHYACSAGRPRNVDILLKKAKEGMWIWYISELVSLSLRPNQQPLLTRPIKGGQNGRQLLLFQYNTCESVSSRSIMLNIPQ